jgi:hypothetical protein
MYVNGLGRAIERIKGVHHTTVILCCISRELLPDAYAPDTILWWANWIVNWKRLSVKKNKSIWLL